MADPNSSSAQDTVIVYDNSKASSPLKYTSFLAAAQNSGQGEFVSLVFGVPAITSLPTSGTATYNGVVGGLAACGTGLCAISGTSTLTAYLGQNYGNNAFTTNLTFSGVSLVNGGPSLAQQSYYGTSSPLGYNGANGYGGQLYNSSNKASAGVWSGTFYGPNAEEYGYAFTISDSSALLAGTGPNVVATGAAAGSLQTTTPAPATNPAPYLPSAIEQELAAGTALTYATASSTSSQSVTSTSGPYSPGITYNAAAGTYTLQTPDQTGGIPHDLQYSFDGSMVTSTANNLTIFTNSANGTKLTLYTPSPSAPLVLTYSSYGILTYPNTNSASGQQTQYVAFGVPTGTLPTTGSATYSGIVIGEATSSGVGGASNQNYTLSGTSTLNANFATNTYSTALTFAGTNVIAGGPALATQNLTGTGATSGPTFYYPLYGTLSSAGANGPSGNYVGNFYGPKAAEFAYTFSVAGAAYTATGVAIGKKN